MNYLHTEDESRGARQRIRNMHVLHPLEGRSRANRETLTAVRVVDDVDDRGGRRTALNRHFGNCQRISSRSDARVDRPVAVIPQTKRG